MAVVRKNQRASLRLTDSRQRTIATYSGVKHDTNPDKYKGFAGALEALRGRSFAFIFLNTMADLESE